MTNRTNTPRFALLAVAAAALLAAGCSSQPQPAKDAAQERAQAEQAQAPVPAPPPVPEEKKAEIPAAPKANTFRVRFDTSRGPFVVEVHRDWAPIGAQRFEELVKTGYFNGARFFRVVPNFIVQFGLAGDPAATRKWDRPIKDDPVVQTNRLGSMVFATAGPNTRTAQIFINLRSNQFLDDQGFAPFGMVVEGMNVVQAIYPGYGENPDQGQITARGNSYLNASFPQLDFIKSAAIE
jgi:peptidyl-prolyl cis-trans isomerase A (cyclophilin A)